MGCIVGRRFEIRTAPRGFSVQFVVVDSAHGWLARSVVDRLAAHGAEVITAPGRTSGNPTNDAAADRRPDLVADRVIDAVVLFAPGATDEIDGTGSGGTDVSVARTCLDGLDAAHVRHVVVLSSAMVYGAEADRPIPMTEAQPVDPSPGCLHAAARVELESLAAAWGSARGVPVTLLRPCVVVGSRREHRRWFAASLWCRSTARHGDADPPAQLLALSDLAAAVVHALGLTESERGVPYNVAPDGWITTEDHMDVAGRRGVRIPEPAAGASSRLRWRLGLSSTPADALPYAMEPWVVANDRFRATGWAPALSNDEALVAVTNAGWWASKSSRRRQELALGGSVGGLALAAAAIGVAIRQARGRVSSSGPG